VELNDYQSQASKTDQRPDASEQAMLIPMLGIAGEIGTLLAEYKRQIRDGEANVLFREHVREELGDILWYAANLATKIGWQLEDIATYNLDKTRDRWNALGTSPHYFDETYPTNERLPRRFDVLFAYDDVNGQKKLVVTDDLGQPVGNPLSDNAYEGDGYRFHDAYHFTFAALLGWSPVARRNFKRKRKSDPVVDEVEDGGRGWVIEEGIASMAHVVPELSPCHECLQTLRTRLAVALPERCACRVIASRRSATSAASTTGPSSTSEVLQRLSRRCSSSSTNAKPPLIPAAKFRPVAPSTTTTPPVMYSHP